jgi:hypothetical membrane protein
MLCTFGGKFLKQNTAIVSYMAEPKNVVYLKMGGVSGVLTPVVAFVGIAIAIASYPAFSWTNNALSDLGVISGLTMTAFNFGIYTSGLLSLAFAGFGLFTYFGKSWVGKVGSGFFAGASLSLMAIGFFNESFRPTHYIVSVAFFALAPISLFILTGALLISKQHKLAVFSMVVAFAAAAPWILQLTLNYLPNVAIPEALSGIVLSVWAIVMSKFLLKPNPVL